MLSFAVISASLAFCIAQTSTPVQLEYEGRFEAAEKGLRQLTTIDLADTGDQKLRSKIKRDFRDDFIAGNPAVFLPRVVVNYDLTPQSFLIDWSSDENLRELAAAKIVPVQTRDIELIAPAIQTARGLRADLSPPSSDELRSAADILSREAFRCLSTWNESSESSDSVRAWSSALLDLSRRAQAHAHYDDVKLMPIARLAQVTALSRRTVAIFVDDGVNGPKPCGSGVLFHRVNSGASTFYLATAAHVLADSRMYAGGRLRWQDFMPQRVSVRLVDEYNGFADPQLSITLGSNAQAVKFNGTSDFAVVRLEVPQTLAERVKSIASAQIEESTSIEDCQAGLVFGFSAIREQRAELTWIPPGRIAFPATVRPSDFGLPPDQIDVWWVRAVAQQLMAKGGMVTSERAFAKICDDVRSAYCPPGSDDLGFMLCSPVGHDNLSKLVGDATTPRDPKIRCFGTDLVTDFGCSGGPVYDLRSDPPRLVGIVSGRAGGEGGDLMPRSLENYARIVPWVFIQEGLP